MVFVIGWNDRVRKSNGLNSYGLDIVQTILHQRYQRQDNKCHSLTNCSRQLVSQTFATACGNKRDHILLRLNCIDNLLLILPKVLIAKAIPIFHLNLPIPFKRLVPILDIVGLKWIKWANAVVVWVYYIVIITLWVAAAYFEGLDVVLGLWLWIFLYLFLALFLMRLTFRSSLLDFRFLIAVFLQYHWFIWEFDKNYEIYLWRTMKYRWILI